MSLVKDVYQRSSPRSMDFHPLLTTYLLVGTDAGEVSLWNLASRHGISGITVSFKVWDVKSFGCREFLLSIREDPSISVNCIRWSSDGVYFGVAFSKYVVHLYYYHGGIHIARLREIVAHNGSVNDIFFTYIKNRHMIITCGDDGCIKGWDLSSRTRLFSFEGDAEKPVYCIRPCIQDNTLFLNLERGNAPGAVANRVALEACVQARNEGRDLAPNILTDTREYILSTSSDGHIRLWSHDTATSVIIHRTGSSSVAMAFSKDGERLFSCGKNVDSSLSLFEWSQNGQVRRTYEGLTVCASNIVQVETTIARILAVGNDHQVKFWVMDESDLLMSYDAESLPATPVIRFNKSGSLLAVSTSDNRIRVLATVKDRKLSRSRRTFEVAP